MTLVIQNHHIIYGNDKNQEDFVVAVYKGEHWAITQLQRRKNISKGFIKALKHWILVNEDDAVELA